MGEKAELELGLGEAFLDKCFSGLLLHTSGDGELTTSAGSYFTESLCQGLESQSFCLALICTACFEVVLSGAP